MKTAIKVTTDFEGIHSWPDAPAAVGFLSVPHRHKFFVSLTIAVEHDDRELEFFLVQRELKSWLPTTVNLGLMSCEMIAKDILAKAVLKYGQREMVCEVSEDGENSAVVYL